MQRRQAGKQQDAYEQQQYEAQQQQAQMQAAAQQAVAQQQAAMAAAQPPAPAAAPATDLVGELQKLGALRDQGILSDAEFAAAKAKLLG